ncbi:MAG: trypsin-like peptidase domain-containing protein [Thermoplasmata archaeon]|nr:trypsin-like peptidase domain-containing protein [Thermoplasmata archaeon]
MSLPELEEQLVGAAARLRASVVRIRRTAAVGPPRSPVEIEASGSGLIVDARGYLVTNDHVVRKAREIRVTLDGGEELHADVVGEDPATDVALLRVGARELPAAPFADSERLRVGQFALALGNSLGLPGGPSLSVGVVSALGRPLPGADHVLEGLVQTDAAINPGNSGGPLADLGGSVIGVNTAIIPYAQGIGFAVPSNTVQHIIEEIRRAGRVVRPWLGISAVALDAPLALRLGVPASTGVLLADVVRASPADDAGLRSGDVLVRIGEGRLRSLRDLLRSLAQMPIGGAVDFEFSRNGRTRTGVLRIAEAPPALLAA